MRNEADAIAFLMRLIAGLHRHGAPAHRLEEVANGLAPRLGLQGSFFSMPTAFLAAFGPPEAQRTSLVRLEPGVTDLGRQVQLDDVATEVAAGRIDPAEGIRRVDAILAMPPSWPPALTLASFAAGSAATARLLGGGWREMAGAAAIGFLVGVLAMVLRPSPVQRVFEPAAALAGSVVVAVAAWLMTPLSTSVTILAGLITLIPGLALTTAVNELASRHLISGTARLMGALTSLLIIGLGVALGERIALLFAVQAVARDPAALPLWTTYPALGVGLLAVSVLFRVPGRDIPVVLVAGSAAWGAAHAADALLGPDLAVGLATFVLGLLSNLHARVRQRPASLVLVPGLMLLVPGSLGLRSLLLLMDRNVVTGMESAFQVGMVAVTLVTGMLVANVVLPPRRPL